MPQLAAAKKTNNQLSDCNGCVQHELGVDPVTVATAGKGIVDTFKSLFGGKKESKADKTKQQIQQDLANLGYPQFSQMSGFKGNEKAKRDAMQAIYDAVTVYTNAGITIQNYLENGNVTPQTVQKVKSNFPVVTTMNTTNPNGGGTTKVPAKSTGSSLIQSGFNPGQFVRQYGWHLLGTAVVVGGTIYYINQNN